MTNTIIVGPTLARSSECEAILRSLPKWFGIEHAIQMYVEDTTRYPTFATEVNGVLTGFLTLRQHFPETWEVHAMAVHAEHRHKGMGRCLLAHAEDWLITQNARFLQVKTVADTSPCPEYAETRKFYATQGFIPLEIFPTLWDPHNPALQCIKALTPPEALVAE